MSLRTLPLRPPPAAGAAAQPVAESASSSVATFPGVRVARIGGSEVVVHPVWLVGVPALGMLLAAGRVGIEAQLAMGLQPLAWALCALIHEAAHSVVAKRTGLRVRIIALRPAGGVTVYDGNTVSDREQVWISGAGPAASLALAVLAIGGAMCSSGSLGQALRFLACFNVAVFAFNALPALPLDGGRVARAVLSMRGQTVTQTHRTLERLRGASGYSLGALGAGLIVLAPFSPLTMTVCGVVLLWTGWTLIPGDGCKDRGRPDARAD